MNPTGFSPVATPRFGKTAQRPASPAPKLQFGSWLEEFKTKNPAPILKEQLKKQGDVPIKFENGHSIRVAVFLGHLYERGLYNIDEMLEGLPPLKKGVFTNQKTVLQQALDTLVSQNILYRSQQKGRYGIYNDGDGGKVVQTLKSAYPDLNLPEKGCTYAFLRGEDYLLRK
ncbi:MAG TPA: hypothetical protein V6C52_14870 [Coleofasciculaceae cyanobacterium]|jgi:hypothetical protein